MQTVLTLAIVSLIVLLILALAFFCFAEGSIGTGVLATLVAVAVGMTGVNSSHVTYSNEHVATCMVTSKYHSSEGGSYTVYTENCGTLLLNNGETKSIKWEMIPEKGPIKVRIADGKGLFLSRFTVILEIVNDPLPVHAPHYPPRQSSVYRS